VFFRRGLTGYVVLAAVLFAMSGCSSCGKEPDDLPPAPASSTPTVDTEHASSKRKRGVNLEGTGWGTIPLRDAGGSSPQ
jgi:predicted small lipoprotein YifL